MRDGAKRNQRIRFLFCHHGYLWRSGTNSHVKNQHICVIFHPCDHGQLPANMYDENNALQQPVSIK
jgi:hypothetical protein